MGQPVALAGCLRSIKSECITTRARESVRDSLRGHEGRASDAEVVDTAGHQR